MATAGSSSQSAPEAKRHGKHQGRRWRSQQTNKQKEELVVVANPQRLEPPERPSAGDDETLNRGGLTLSSENRAPENTVACSTSNASDGPNNAASSARDARLEGPRTKQQRGHERISYESSNVRGTAANISQNQRTSRSHPSRVMATTGRQFGGHLSSTAKGPQRGSNITSTLQGGAPEFQPRNIPANPPSAAGEVGLSATRKTYPGGVHQARPGSKSAAPDLATRIHDDIAFGAYECPICTYEVGRKSKVWYCRICWTVFHLSCIKKWSKNEGSAQADQSRNREPSAVRMWRCPGCNLPTDTVPSTYTCWCTKDDEPRPVPGLPPHSCGQTCGKLRTSPKKCPHPCELICHAGPCPPCTHMGPIRPCFCGKKSITKKCLDTNYDTGWSCETVCGDLMPCGEHTCEKTCHQGFCGACGVEVPARCYCGKVEKLVSCSGRGQQRQSQRAEAISGGQPPGCWIGSFGCQKSCGRFFDCGRHICEQRCHTQQAKPGHCPRSPDVVSRCPCGKTPINNLQASGRRTCEDLIPNCDKKCLKKLACGHECTQICHAGDCMPCLQRTDITCGCGRTKSTTICHQGSVQPPQCMRICRATLNCGRHECTERCCAGERKAIERQSSRRKQRPLNTGPPLRDEGFEAEHICTRNCGRKLKCRNHSCGELCHKGPCGSCREAVFDELSCHCGRTVLHPPLPCGTKSPACGFNCERNKSCGHPQVTHNCHGDEEECPKCPFLMEKGCICGKKTLRNQQCWRNDVSCGEVCGKLLRCGSHHCRRTCHGPGECEDLGRSCQQTCGKAKKACQHPCEEVCHAPYACRQEKACQFKILVTCSCQHIKKEMRCNASKSNAGNQKETLNCDEECARLERNRKLALALNIDPDTHTDEHIPYSKDTLEMFSGNAKWAQVQERAFRIFAADEKEKRMRLKPMSGYQRAFVHALAEDFGFDSESLDPEPHRHVVVLKTPRFVMAPMKTLSQCIGVKNSITRPSSAVVSASAGTSNRLNGVGLNHSNSHNLLPFNSFLLEDPRFGLTVEELHEHLDDILTSNKHLTFGIEFHSADEELVILKAKARQVPMGLPLPEKTVVSFLLALKPLLWKAIQSRSLAGNVLLCRIDPTTSLLTIQRRELSKSTGQLTGQESDDGAKDEAGWSRVVAKAASSSTAAIGSRWDPRRSGVFTVLGSRGFKGLRKGNEKEVDDDWEKAEEEEELREKESIGRVD